MPRLAPLLLILAVTLVAGCRKGADEPAAVPENVGLATPEEVDPTAATATAAGVQPSGEPGMPGSPRPENTVTLADGQCFIYPNWVVTVRPRAGQPGQDVTTFRREGDGQAQCQTPATQGFAATAAGQPQSFFGLRGDLLFIDTGTGSDGRELTVMDLAANGKVLQATYEEPVAIEGNVLTYTEPINDYDDLATLEATGVQCPQAAEWFTNGFAVGVNRVVRFDLDTREPMPSEERVCVPIQ